MPRLRIAFFGSSSSFAALALRELASGHDVVAALRPQWPGLRHELRAALRLQPETLEHSARDLGVRILDAGDTGAALRDLLAGLRPDLICIGMFPRRIPAEVRDVARLGAINAHPSLLPRHRGPLPLFWTYHADDREAGVTVHRAVDRFDAGDILLQERFELPRGHPVAELDRETARRAGRMLREAADALAGDRARSVPQDHCVATSAPFVRAGEAMVRFDEWDVERVWHFLAGLAPRWREPVLDVSGRPVAYVGVTGYRREPSRLAPGRAERAGGSVLLHCRGGIVELAEERADR